jgi:protein SCO1/2
MMRVLLFIALIFLAACDPAKKERVLPFIGNYDIEYKLVDGVEVADTVYPKIPSFTFTNQNGKKVKSTDFKGKVWVAEFFFTSCPTICPKMTRNMLSLQASTKDLKKEIQFMSFTINPDFDQPKVLKRYAKHYGVDESNWVFLTGDEEETHFIGIEHFKTFAGRDAEEAGGFAHSGAFTLVDKEGYVRGVYLGTDKKQVKQLEEDLRKLLKYEYDIE